MSIYAIEFVKHESMNLKQSGEGYMGMLEGGKGRRDVIIKISQK